MSGTNRNFEYILQLYILITLFAGIFTYYFSFIIFLRPTIFDSSNINKIKMHSNQVHCADVNAYILHTFYFIRHTCWILFRKVNTLVYKIHVIKIYLDIFFFQVQ